jgi:hypothetical protein
MCCELQAKYASIDELTQLWIGGMQRYLDTLLKDADYTTQSGKEVRLLHKSTIQLTHATVHHSVPRCVH